MAPTLCLLFGILPVVFGLETYLVPPIKEGVDVAVLVFPGAYLTVDQYEQLGVDLQELSDLRIWLTFTGDFPGDLVNPLSMIQAFEQALPLLEASGFPPGSPIFAAGHSLAGVFAPDIALRFPEVTGMILWAAYFQGDNILDYPLPALTLSGDIDGQTIITILATSYEQLTQLVEVDDERKISTPVILLEDVNHGIYATGELPDRVLQEDIPSPLEGSEGRRLIAEATNAFLIANVLDGDAAESARLFLTEAYDTTGQMVQPILSMRLEEQDGGESSWVQTAQVILSSIDESQSDSLLVNNVFVDTEDDFAGTRTSREVLGGMLVANTSAYTTRLDMGAKMNSRDGLQLTAQEGGLDLSFGDFVPCADINSAALDFAYSSSSDLARQRFDDKGIQVNFQDDLEAATGPEFVESRLSFSFDPLTLEANVQATRIVVDPDSALFPGAHYCRLWSPLNALEFIYINSLKNKTIPA